MGSPTIVVRRLADRPVSASEGVVSRHGLSFGAHYDPARTSFGALVAHNDDVLAPGVSYGAHTHADVEILSWVLDGTMEHVGPSGRVDTVGVGTLQHLDAGTGWHHDERCGGSTPVRLLQVWVAPALDGPPASTPSLAHLPVDPGDGPVTLDLHRRGVTLTVARLPAGERWEVASASWRHVHVARGGLVRPEPVEAGDSLEVTGEGPLTVEAGDEGAEVLVVATA